MPALRSLHATKGREGRGSGGHPPIHTHTCPHTRTHPNTHTLGGWSHGGGSPGDGASPPPPGPGSGGAARNAPQNDARRSRRSHDSERLAKRQRAAGRRLLRTGAGGPAAGVPHGAGVPWWEYPQCIACESRPSESRRARRRAQAGLPRLAPSRAFSSLLEPSRAVSSLLEPSRVPYLWSPQRRAGGPQQAPPAR